MTFKYYTSFKILTHLFCSGVNGTEHVAEAKKIDPTFIVACNHRTAFGTLILT